MFPPLFMFYENFGVPFPVFCDQWPVFSDHCRDSIGLRYCVWKLLRSKDYAPDSTLGSSFCVWHKQVCFAPLPRNCKSVLFILNL